MAGDLGFLILTAMLIGLNALYVFHEFAFVMITPAQIKRLSETPTRIARLIVKASRRLDHYIAVDQLGITVTSIAVGWFGQPVAADLISGLVGSTPAPAGVAAVTSGVIAFVLLTMIQMVFGELVPKTIALRHPMKVARIVARPVELFALAFHPLVWVLNGIGMWLARALGFHPHPEGHHRSLPAEEIVTIVEMSSSAGVLAADPAMLRRALSFSDLKANDLLVPRQEIVAVGRDWPLARVLAHARECRFTRFPVYYGTIDHVVGLLNLKDTIEQRPDGSLGTSENWQRAITTIPIVPETAPIDHILTVFNANRQPIALVVDEYGGTAGLVTVSDIADRLIGETDEFTLRPDGSYAIPGNMSVADVETALDISFGDEHADQSTIGGIVVSALRRFANPGDIVTINGHELVVDSVAGRRIASVLLRVDANDSAHHELRAPGGAWPSP